MKVKVVPFPTSDSTLIFPPCSSTYCLHKYKPNTKQPEPGTQYPGKGMVLGQLGYCVGKKRGLSKVSIRLVTQAKKDELIRSVGDLVLKGELNGRTNGTDREVFTRLACVSVASKTMSRHGNPIDGNPALPMPPQTMADTDASVINGIPLNMAEALTYWLHRSPDSSPIRITNSDMRREVQHEEQRLQALIYDLIK